MPEDKLSPEAAAKAALNEEIPPGPYRTDSPEHQARQIRNKLQEESVDSALEDMRGAARESGPLEKRERFDRYIEEGIGWERDDNGQTTRTGEVERRYNNAKRFSDLGRRYAEGGYDNLRNPQKDQAKRLVEEGLRRFPHIDAELTALGNGKDTLIESLLRDPKFAMQARSMFEGNIDEFVNSQSNIKELITQRQKELNETQKEIDKNREEKRRAGNNLRQTNTELSGYEAGGTQRDELDGIRNDLSALHKELSNRRSRKESDEREVDEKRSERSTKNRNDPNRTTITGEINRIEGRIRGHQNRIAEIEREISEKESRQNELLQEKKEKEQKKREIEQKLEELRQETNDLVYKKIQAQTDYEIVKDDKERQEQALVNELENVLKSSAVDFMDQKLTEIQDAGNKIIQEKAEEATSQAEKDILEEIQERYAKKVKKTTLGFNRGYKLEYNRDRIRQDWDYLLQNSPKEIVKRILQENGHDESLADKEEFLEKVQSPVVEKLISSRLQKGGINRNEAEILVNTDWGEQAVRNALSKNETAKESLNNLMAEQGIKGDPIEFIKRNPFKTGLVAVLLALLFGGGIAALSAAGGVELLRNAIK